MHSYLSVEVHNIFVSPLRTHKVVSLNNMLRPKSVSNITGYGLCCNVLCIVISSSSTLQQTLMRLPVPRQLYFLTVLMHKFGGTMPTMLSHPLLLGGVPAGQAYLPWRPLAEEGSRSLVPTSMEGVATMLNGLTEQQYGVGIATMAYTAQRAKFAQGTDRQQWTELFIDSFKYVYGDIMGDPEKALELC